MTDNQNSPDLSNLPPDLQAKVARELQRASDAVDATTEEANSRNASAKFKAMIDQYVAENNRRPNVDQLEQFKVLIRASGHPNYY